MLHWVRSMSRDSQECSKIYRQVFFFKALGRESNCLKETFKSLFLSLLRKEITASTVGNICTILPLPVFGFLGDVLPIQHMLQAATAEMFCIPRSFTPHWAFSFTHFGKRFIIGSGTDGSKSYKRQWLGWTWLYVGLRVTDEVEGENHWLWGREVCWWQTVWELENSLVGSWTYFWTKRVVLSSWDFVIRQMMARYP